MSELKKVKPSHLIIKNNAILEWYPNFIFSYKLGGKEKKTVNIEVVNTLLYLVVSIIFTLIINWFMYNGLQFRYGDSVPILFIDLSTKFFSTLCSTAFGFCFPILFYIFYKIPGVA